MTDDEAEAGPSVRIPFAAGIALTISVAATLAIGVLPGRVIHVADRAVPVVLVPPETPAK